MRAQIAADKGWWPFRRSLEQTNSSPNHFMFCESWQSRDLWRQHMDAPHISAFGQPTQGAGDRFALGEMTRID